MKFIVNEKLFSEYKDLKIGIIVCKNIDNTKFLDDISNEMEKVKKDIKQKFDGVELSNYPIIRQWRDIYKSFGEKKSRSSVENLIKRTVNGKEIPQINPLVDIYNLISLKYELPCGGEDLDTITDDIKLTYAKGDEVFIPLGTDDMQKVNLGEIIYKFANNVICRNFNYRESDLTKITENTQNCILVMESISNDTNILQNALKELSSLVKHYLGGSTNIIILDEINNEMEL